MALAALSRANTMALQMSVLDTVMARSRSSNLHASFIHHAVGGTLNFIVSQHEAFLAPAWQRLLPVSSFSRHTPFLSSLQIHSQMGHRL